MKKWLAVVISALLCLSLAACGQKPASVEEYVAKNKDTISAAVSASAGDGLNIEVLGRGNSLVYRYKYTTELGELDAVKAALESATDKLESTFKSILTAVKTEVPSAESVIVEYLTKDGEVIVSKEFK